MSPHFAPIAALIGGILIGLSTALLWLGLGRIAGISGIVVRTLQGSVGEERIWRTLFLLGLPLGAAAAVALGWADRPSTPPANLMLAAVGGVLVGIGTRLGSGCTSGHGICGLSRLSPRSLVATMAFMAAGMVTASLATALIGG